MSYKASVIIPVYNAEKTLRRSVESLLLGVERNIEVILCEDHSKDKSWDLCQSLAQEFSNVTSLRNDCNRGVSYTRNHGLTVAAGEYILFVDSDDWVSSRYVAKLLELAHQYPYALSICGEHFLNYVNGDSCVFTWKNQRGNIVELGDDQLFDLVDQFLLQQLWNKIFRRDIIEKYNIRFDETQSMGEDFQFVLDYMEAAKIQKCVVLNEPLYYYIRWNNNSLMSRFGLTQCQQEFERAEQLHRISGLVSTDRRDALVARNRQNYIYHISRNSNLSQKQRLEAIERIMGDGNSRRYYNAQRRMFAKERIAAVLPKIKKLPERIKGRFSRQQNEKLIAQASKKIHAKDFTIISQNCIGGVLYHDLGMEFLSPTINTFIPEPGFVRMVLNLKHYMAQPLVIRWGEEYPIGMLDDVEIHFMHYETCQEAKAAWDRRVKRINWDKILVLATDRDGFDDAVYAQWKQISYPKVLFTANPKYTEDAVYFHEYASYGQVKDLIPERKFYQGDVITVKINTLAD